MRKAIFILILFVLMVPDYAVCVGTQILHLDFLVENNADTDFKGVVLINAQDVYSLIPGFDGYSFIVTTTHSSDLASDLEIKTTDELVSQPLDEDGDGRIDKLAVYMSLGVLEKKVITVHIGQADQILRLKGQDKKRCDAVKSKDGILWESDKVGYRYNPVFNVISIIGKMTHRNILDLITVPHYNRSKRTLLGEELFVMQKAPGFAGLGILKKGAVSGLSGDKADINAKGPLASIVNISSTAKNGIKINSVCTLFFGSRWTWVEADVSGNWNKNKFAVGIPVRTDEKTFGDNGLIATLAGSPLLGLAVYIPDKYLAGKVEQDGYHLALLRPDEKGRINYAFAAYWELEHRESVAEQGELDEPISTRFYRKQHKRTGRVLLRQPRMNSMEEFQKRLKYDMIWITENRIKTERISEKAMTYTENLPPEAVRKNRKKSYEEALNLLIKRVRFFAEKCLTEEGREEFWITSNPEGKPSYIKPNRSWGDGYWVSMLWDAYKVTGDEQFKRWALKSNRLMFGGEEIHSIATGVNYWHSSVRSYRETGDPVWRESALKCADTFGILIDPITNYDSGWDIKSRKKPYFNSEIAIDAMMCIPVLWWAYEETKDKKYLDAALRHTDETIRFLIEPDGSVFHISVHDTTTGALLGIGSNQGVGANSRWARGIGWVFDGFADAYKFTRKQEYLDVFQTSFEWLIQNMPEDLVPWYDFDDQGVFWRLRDTSTSAISAYGLLRMSELVTDKNLAKQYRDYAVRLVNSLVDNYLTPVGPDDSRPQGMFAHQCYVKLSSGEQVWGSFALMKALVWLKENDIRR